MFNLNDFDLSAKSGRSSSYQGLYNALKALKVGEFVVVTNENGYNDERTYKHNKTNILSCIGKCAELEGFKFKAFPPKDENAKMMVLICEQINA